MQLTFQGLQISNELLENLDNGKENKVHQITHDGKDEPPNKKHKRDTGDLTVHGHDIIDLTNETEETIDNYNNTTPRSAPCPIIKTADDFFIIPLGLEILPSTESFCLPKLSNEPPDILLTRLMKEYNIAHIQCEKEIELNGKTQNTNTDITIT